MKVEFGAGGNRPNGWTTHDAEVDITKPLPYGDNTVDKIRAEHVCEHVTGPEFLRFLDECYRILKPGGRIRLCMPVLTNLDLVECRDIITNHGHLCAYNAALINTYVRVAGFKKGQEFAPRNDTDGHHRVIGKERDDKETYRCEAIK